jgi:hypothetical protein
VDHAFTIFDFSDLVAARRDFLDAKQIGSGGFGPLYRVRRVWWSNGAMHECCRPKQMMAHQMPSLFQLCATPFQWQVGGGFEIAVKCQSSRSGQGLE